MDIYGCAIDLVMESGVSMSSMTVVEEMRKRRTCGVFGVDSE